MLKWVWMVVTLTGTMKERIDTLGLTCIVQRRSGFNEVLDITHGGFSGGHCELAMWETAGLSWGFLRETLSNLASNGLRRNVMELMLLTPLGD